MQLSCPTSVLLPWFGESPTHLLCMEMQTLSSTTASHGSWSATGVSLSNFWTWINLIYALLYIQSSWSPTSTILILHYPTTVAVNGISSMEWLQQSTGTSLDGKAVSSSMMSHTSTLSNMYVFFLLQNPQRSTASLYFAFNSSSLRCLSVRIIFSLFMLILVLSSSLVPLKIFVKQLGLHTITLYPCDEFQVCDTTMPYHWTSRPPLKPPLSENIGSCIEKEALIDFVPCQQTLGLCCGTQRQMWHSTSEGTCSTMQILLWKHGETV